VILSHQRAEQAIAAHATQLTVDLGDAATELGDVFGRLSSALQVTHGDREALKVSQDTQSATWSGCAALSWRQCIFWHPSTAWPGLAADGRSLYHYICSCGGLCFLVVTPLWVCDVCVLQGICDMAGAKLGKLQTSLLAAARAQAGMLQDMRAQVSIKLQRLIAMIPG